MKAVAQSYEYTCLESADRWELYDTVARRVKYTAFKKEEPNYLKALLAKWGFEEVDFEVGGYHELDPDWEALGYASKAKMEEDSASRNRAAMMADLELYSGRLKSILDGNK